MHKELDSAQIAYLIANISSTCNHDEDYEERDQMPKRAHNSED